MPAVLRWPGTTRPGSASSLATVTSDFLPTILAALDLEPPADRDLDGIDVLPLLRMGSEVRGQGIGFAIRRAASWVTDTHKLITNDGGATFELYDLIEDPREQTDLAAARPELVRHLRRELEAWRRTWAAPPPTVEPANAAPTDPLP